jgi:hypothetical protein
MILQKIDWSIFINNFVIPLKHYARLWQWIMLIFFVDDYSHKLFTYLFFSFSLHNHCLRLFSLLLKIRKVRFFQTCLIWVVAILCSYLHQQKIAQSRETHDTWFRKVNLKIAKAFNICMLPQKTHYNIQKQISVSINMASSLLTLPVEIVYHILDNVSDKTIFLSLINVCTRLNTIISTYHRYQVNFSFIFEVSLSSSSKHCPFWTKSYILPPPFSVQFNARSIKKIILYFVRLYVG